MKYILNNKVLLGLVLFTLGLTACNEEWQVEQYEHYISLKAPLNEEGVSRIYIPYREKGKYTYNLPVIVSGSTSNPQDLQVHIGVDSDTLQILNNERFQLRKDFYYHELMPQFFSMPETVAIPSGQDVGLFPITFDLTGIDLSEKWLLPLTVVDGAGYHYKSHPRKHYDKGLLHIIPFNDYSGSYSATALKIFLRGNENNEPIVRNSVPVYVVDEHSAFMYAGMIDDKNIDRKRYKIKMTFDDENKTVALSAYDESIGFESFGTTTFKIDEVMDDVRPYLLHRYITINNIDYIFTDVTTSTGNEIPFSVKGSLMMERRINTQIPDIDQAIEW